MTRPQEDFWKKRITKSYAEDNSQFDEKLGLLAWSQMLEKVDLNEIKSFLDCGSNIGRNVRFLGKFLPNASANIIELAEDPYNKCKKDFNISDSYLGSIKDAAFSNKFDLVFTNTVLIHVNPDDLLKSMEKMYEFSSKYILICEYFNRTPVMIEYRGELDMLFKRDFGKLFIENFDCEIVDYGFLWGHQFDNAGFDDITYWLFRKK